MRSLRSIYDVYYPLRKIGFSPAGNIRDHPVLKTDIKSLVDGSVLTIYLSLDELKEIVQYFEQEDENA